MHCLHEVKGQHILGSYCGAAAVLQKKDAGLIMKIIFLELLLLLLLSFR